jgi:hypothetical protein
LLVFGKLCVESYVFLFVPFKETLGTRLTPYQVRRITNLGNIATLIVSLIGLALWIAAAVLYKIDDMNQDEHYDMLSYTCARRHDEVLDRAIGNLGTLCLQMRYAWWAAVVVGVLEIAAIITVAWGMWSSRRAVKGSYTKLGKAANDQQLKPLTMKERS